MQNSLLIVLDLLVKPLLFRGIRFRMYAKHILVWILVLTNTTLSELPPPCDSEIYCIADNTYSLLHVVQMARIYSDSKTFVDKPIKTSPKEVIQNFNEFMKVN